jgi:hypothetical protein
VGGGSSASFNISLVNFSRADKGLRGDSLSAHYDDCRSYIRVVIGQALKPMKAIPSLAGVADKIQEQIRVALMFL